MVDTLVIERVTEAGWESAIGLLERQLDEHEIPFDPPALQAAARGLVARQGRGAILIARDDATPIGVAALTYIWTLEHGGKVAWLEELYVEPAYRNRGIGTRLLIDAMTLARTEGCLALDLEVVEAQGAAIRLYERHGFGQLGRIRMARRLASTGADPVPAHVPDALGGCLCGAIRFRALGLPASIGYCHCSMCRRATGAPAVAWATYPASSVLIVAGKNEVKTHRSSTFAQRSFCGECGSPLLFRYDKGTDIDVCVGAFDEPASLAPTYHIFDSARLPWFDGGPDLARFSDQGPDSPGYTPT